MKYFKKLHSYYPVAVKMAGALYLIGIIGLAWLHSIPAAWYATGPFLLLTGLILWVFHENPHKSDLFPVIIAYLLGFVVEMVGTNTGWPFGHYNYGKILGPALWKTPLLIGFNWFLLTYMVQASLHHFKINSWLGVTLGAFTLVFYDYLLEPVAIYSGMWTWQDGQPPIQNYIGWFGLSWIILALYRVFRFHPINRLAPWILLFQTVFFGILGLII
ncbi:MAG: hypothetical protein PWR20_1579 [Bacteroidales bacterium]|jgi:putative membrane protein|nr:hypothetical protein [Bacteroidales bacterium]MDN5330714.1 hypothetical protein [Bacteroidales bacterium]